jgi:hypothetical protein
MSRVGGIVQGLLTERRSTGPYRVATGSVPYSLYFVPEPPYSTCECGQCAHPIKIFADWPLANSLLRNHLCTKWEARTGGPYLVTHADLIQWF